MTSAATHYAQVALDAKLSNDHPLDERGLPTFTSSERAILQSLYRSLPDTPTRALRDHQAHEKGAEVLALIHEPSEWHPCGACRADANPRSEFVGPSTPIDKE